MKDLQELVNPIISLKCAYKENLKLRKHIDCMCYNTPGSSNSGKHLIKIPRFN